MPTDKERLDAMLQHGPEWRADNQKLMAAGVLDHISKVMELRICRHGRELELCPGCAPVAKALLAKEPTQVLRRDMISCRECGVLYSPDEVRCPRCDPNKEAVMEHGISPDGRIPMPEVMLRFAEELAERSTCERLRVGAVVTDENLMQVLGIGYNGNASGLPNRCDSTVPGQCGCLHAEINALLKAPGILPGKHLFVTQSPCSACAKAAINARIVAVHYRTEYRDPSGLEILARSGVMLRHLPPLWWVGADE